MHNKGKHYSNQTREYKITDNGIMTVSKWKNHFKIYISNQQNNVSDTA